MVRQAYAKGKFSCKTKKNTVALGGEKAHISRKGQGSHRKLKIKPFNVKIKLIRSLRARLVCNLIS